MGIEQVVRYTKPLILVAIPSIGDHSFLFTQYLVGQQYPSNFSMHIRFLSGMEVGRARNLLVQEAIHIGARYILFVDEDVIPPSNGLRRLLYHLENHPEWTVCGGVYGTKTVPSEPLIYMEWGAGPYWGWKRGELLKVKFTGCGFHLLRVDDLKNMKTPEPYPERNPWGQTPDEMVQTRKWFYTGQMDVGNERYMWTEDSWFYHQCDEEGLQTWIDTDIQCQHYDAKEGNVYSVPIDHTGRGAKPDAWNSVPRVCNLGSGLAGTEYEVNVDLIDHPSVNYKCDVRVLPSEWTEQFDLVRAHHLLEHFDYGQTEEILREWIRIIKPGGKLDLHVPDLEWVATQIVEKKMIGEWEMGCLYGDEAHPFWRLPAYGGFDERGRFLKHSNQHNHHKAGFTKQSLGNLLHRLGLTEIRGTGSGYQFNLEATKPQRPGIEPKVKVPKNKGKKK